VQRSRHAPEGVWAGGGEVQRSRHAPEAAWAGGGEVQRPRHAPEAVWAGGGEVQRPRHAPEAVWAGGGEVQAAVEAEAPRWQPEWGKPTAYQVGDMALFWNQDGSTSVGKVMQVDMLARPPMFVVEVRQQRTLDECHSSKQES
jgi:hypothetical protein